MKQYINKSAVVVEIDRRIQFFTEESGNSNSDIVIALFGLKYFIDTLEVKEIDNIWHDASEELPVMHRRVLLYTEEGTVMQGMQDGGSWVLDVWVPKFPKILKWCYLSDIIPT